MSPANDIDTKKKIQSIINEFSEMPFPVVARNLFGVLGYASQRDEKILKIATPEDFLQWLESAHQLEKLSDKDRLDLHNNLEKLYFIFQITDTEIKAALGPIQGNLFDSGPAIDSSPMKSYLVFAALLSPYALVNRSALARIVRLINKPLPMPAIILFRHGDTLTLGIINRRFNKISKDRDVLEKVTLIKDIAINEPNRAHIEILHDLTLSALSHKHQVDNFARLHEAWRKTLDISALNRKFYRELFNWYLFAVKTVKFPNPDKLPEEINNSINVIRLLTRLIFCWFIKEKGLIPEALFNEHKIKEILFDQAPGAGSTYYKAILQNLFFATLNTEMNRDNPGTRRFINERKYDNGFNPDYNNFTVYRHKNLFKDPNAALRLFENIPFLNGGLFECLDTVETGNGKNREIRYDGFSSFSSKQPMVPDLLFFGRLEDVDLSSAYNGKTGRHETIIGLIEVLNSYKFTIMENTPLEEEVALDPELLGKVFENLLASYNPETRSTARNQTGSFYTPREIVNYIVDESLKGILEENLINGKGRGASVKEQKELNGASLKEKLSALFSDAQSGNPFPSEETEILINALSSVRILDPACGSGAFPMGMLHRMVHILGKLDPNNRKWKQVQIDIVEQDRQRALEMRDETVREGAIKSVEDRKAYIEASFESSHHELDYLRKLFLIENCIYGVDIQNIAVQIAKLRFFISLIVEQKRDDSKPNLGILAMPNLETKFVAADTLIGLEKPDQHSFGADVVERAEFELRQVRERIFYARKYRDKKELRKQEKVKREELEKALKQSGWKEATATQIAAWNPFDVAGSAPFFDPEMMFGLSKGFDIVIGNPPYVQIQSFSGRPEQKAWEQQKYATYTKTGDVYCLFYERGFNLLTRGGILAYISSNKWMRANYGAKLRDFFAVQTAPQILIDFGGFQVFDSATVDTNILVLKKLSSDKERPALKAVRTEKDFSAETNITNYVRKKAVPIETLSSESWIITSISEYSVRKRIEEMGVPLKAWDIAINYGIKTGLNEAFIINGKKKTELIAQDPKSAEIIKPILLGRDIKRYETNFGDMWLLIAEFGSHKYLEVKYPIIYAHLLQYKTRLEQRGQCRYTSSGRFNPNSSYPGQHHWLELDNNPKKEFISEFEKEKIAWGNLALSAQFALVKKGVFISAPSPLITPASRFLLAVLNSSLGDYYIRSLGVSRSGGYLEYKPMFVEKLPVPKLTPSAQSPYDILVDCVLFAHEKGLASEASTLEWVINVMVYGLYFEEEMKKDYCYINNRMAEVVKPFKPGDSEDFKIEYVKSLALFCLKDKVIYHGLIHSKNVKSVRVILGEKNER
jgi:adenine-specific DNA-methyltransferase